MVTIQYILMTNNVQFDASPTVNSNRYIDIAYSISNNDIIVL